MKYDSHNEKRQNPVFVKWLPKAYMALSASIIAYYIGNRTELHWPPIIPLEPDEFAVLAKCVGAFFGAAFTLITFYIPHAVAPEKIAINRLLRIIFKTKYLKVFLVPFAFIALCEIALAFL